MKEIQCTNGKVAQVSDEDFEFLNRFKWFGCEYPQARIRKRVGVEVRMSTIAMHTFILRGPEGMMPDHINGNRYDNRRENLRLATRSENRANCPKIEFSSMNPYKGVRATTWRKDAWIAQITINGTRLELGRFEDSRTAALAYDKAALQHFGEFARLNFPVEITPPT